MLKIASKPLWTVLLAVSFYITGSAQAADTPKSAAEKQLSSVYNSKICKDAGIYPGSGNNAGSALLCLMYLCSFQPSDTEVGAMPKQCQFWGRLTGKINIGKEIQDLKNYMALKSLENAKQKTLKNIEPAPSMGEQIYSGLRLNVLDSTVKDDVLCSNYYFAAQNFGIDLVKNSAFKTLVEDIGCKGKGLDKGRLPLVQKDFVTTHLTSFCSSAEESMNLCKSKPYCSASQKKDGLCDGVTTGLEIALPYDLMASSLVRSDTYRSPMMQDAARRYVENLVMAAMPDSVDPKEVYLNPADALKGTYLFKKGGAKKLANRYQGTAILSMAQNSLYRMYSERKGTTENPAGSSSKSSGTTGTDASTETRFQGQSRGQSLIGTLGVESKRRFTDPGWYANINKASETALLREIANMYALQLMMNYRMREKLERIEAMTALRNAYVANELVGSVEKARIKAKGSGL